MVQRPVTFPEAPPDRIELRDGLALVRVSTDRTAAIVAAVNTSLDHLRPWMEWAAEPASELSIGTFLAAAEELFEQRRDFGYSIVDTTTGAVVGGCGLHGRLGPTGLEIGYWVHGDHVGKGVATDTARGAHERRVRHRGHRAGGGPLPRGQRPQRPCARAAGLHL